VADEVQIALGYITMKFLTSSIAKIFLQKYVWNFGTWNINCM